MKKKIFNKQKMLSFYNQKRAINSLGEDVQTVLDVGILNSLLPQILSLEGYQVTKADFDPSLNPDLQIDLRSEFDIPKNTFDAIVLFQVLEHIPYEDFENAIAKLAEATKRFLVISLPYNSAYFTFTFRFSFYQNWPGVCFQIPRFWSSKPLLADRHYWEIGLKDYPKQRIVNSLEKSGLKIREEYQDKLHPYHYFFVLEKKGNNGC